MLMQKQAMHVVFTAAVGCCEVEAASHAKTLMTMHNGKQLLGTARLPLKRPGRNIAPPQACMPCDITPCTSLPQGILISTICCSIFLHNIHSLAS
jgi:hypothetical protein